MCIKLLFDQNLSYRLVKRVEATYPNSVHIASIGLDKSSDIDVWNYAKTHGFVIVTKDSDFNDLSTLYDFPPQIIWLKLGNSSVDAAQAVLLKYREYITTTILESSIGIIEINA